MKDLNSMDLEAVYAELTRTGLVRRLLQIARDEDLASAGGEPLDITSRACTAESAAGQAAVVARAPGVIAGMRAVPTVLQMFSPDVDYRGRAADGRPVPAGTVLALLAGPLRQILAAERTLLNLLGRLSGIATLTARFVEAAASGAVKPKVFDTRKTTPGLRMLEKYAVRCGGGMSHRLGLDDAVLIKDNHLAGVALPDFARFVAEAAAKARAMALRPGAGGGAGPGLRFVEVEVQSLDQLQRLLAVGGCGVDMVLLDNMGLEDLCRAVQLRDRSGLKTLLEASGGVTLDTIGAIAATGVDRISVGQLTHAAPSLDVALDVQTGA